LAVDRGHIKIKALGFGIQSLGQGVPFTTLFKKRAYTLQIHDWAFMQISPQREWAKYGNE
jgi:hypothetical protein